MVTATTATSEVHPEQGEGPHVGLDAGAAAGIRAGDGQHPHRGLPRWGQGR